MLILVAFVVAFLFPFTQGGSDANMSIATQVIIFAATAMGLNIMVGLAGLLDLGYIAFLGAGAFTAAVLSRSAFATVDIHPPFIVVVLIAGAVSATLGLIIGSPTLRVSGDYLAIVTLAFGEIFRITMINLDGEAGPNITHGSERHSRRFPTSSFSASTSASRMWRWVFRSAASPTTTSCCWC